MRSDLNPRSHDPNRTPRGSRPPDSRLGVASQMRDSLDAPGVVFDVDNSSLAYYHALIEGTETRLAGMKQKPLVHEKYPFRQ